MFLFSEKRPFSKTPLPLTGQAKTLFEKYTLNRFSHQWSYTALMDVLSHLEFLDVLNQRLTLPQSFLALDVGCASWQYLGALTSWFEHQQCPMDASSSLTGVELIKTKRTQAEYYMRIQKEHSALHLDYKSQNICDFKTQANLIFCFFPFLSIDTHKAGGLHQKFYQPERWLKSLVEITKPRGYWVMAHQGEWENKAMHSLMQKAHMHSHFELIEAKTLHEHLHPTPYSVFVNFWMRKDSGLPVDSTPERISPRSSA